MSVHTNLYHIEVQKCSLFLLPNQESGNAFWITEVFSLPCHKCGVDILLMVPSVLQELLPLVLSFELPAIMQSDPSSPTVQHISQTYNLTVSFKPPTRLYRASGVVRGSQNNTNAVKVRLTLKGSEEATCCKNTILY